MDPTLHEQTIMLSIFRLGKEAYGVPIRSMAIERIGRPLHFGTLYNTLDKLVKKGFLITRRGEPTGERGGRSRIYYHLTTEGLRALHAARDLQRALWNDIPENIIPENGVKNR